METEKTVVFVVGRMIAEESAGFVWDFFGVFDTEKAAVAACTTPQHFVGPVELNFRTPDERENWPGSWFPLAEDKPQ